MATIALQDGKVVLKDEKVSCSCCEPCTCVFSDGDVVTISALGKSTTVTIGQGTFPCWGDIGEQREDQVFIRFKTRYTVSDGSTGMITKIGFTAIRGDIRFKGASAVLTSRKT